MLKNNTFNEYEALCSAYKKRRHTTQMTYDRPMHRLNGSPVYILINQCWPV